MQQPSIATFAYDFSKFFVMPKGIEATVATFYVLADNSYGIWAGFGPSKFEITRRLFINFVTSPGKNNLKLIGPNLDRVC